MSGSSWRSFSGLFLFLSAAALASAAPSPSNKNEKSPPAEGLVKEALHSEIYGANAERAKLLDEARQLSPDYAPARWHSGQVRYHNQWLNAADAPQQAEKELPLVEYRNLRDSYPLTIDGQLGLANWCKRKGLLDQERAHLTRVLDLDPDQGEARQRLGFRRISGVWMLDSELKQAQDRGAAAAKALALWTPKLEELRNQMAPQRAEIQRKAAREKLAAINDPDAIPALEVVFSAFSKEAGLTLLDVFAAMPGEQGVPALARQAVLSPFDIVRTSAARRLKSKPADSYVPALLSAMYTPAQSRTEVYNGPGNRLMYRHSFLREGHDAKELVVLETAFKREALVNGDAADTLGRTLGAIQTSAANREHELARQNADSDQLNDRICSVLTVTQDVDLAPYPENWWQWWNEHNEVFTAGDKTLNHQYQLQRVTVQDRYVMTPSGSLSGGGSGMSMMAMDCLAAGTKVWTISGPLSIESVKVGDLVLSQNVETGELLYKPVLKTTVRPAGRLVQATVANETLESSGGHLFWASGDGWAKARKLKSGAELHTLDGTISVSTVEEGRFDQTYNLVVADFNTYFVGDHKILSHDNTIKRRTAAVVPGLMGK